MARFAVDRAFYLPARDLMVLTGAPDEGEVGPADLVDLPSRLGGPGPVPIESIEWVRFEGGREVPAVCVRLVHIESTPDFEPAHLEGQILEVTTVS
jgi:hypothetical protein